jgi:hypothetical protein
MRTVAALLALAVVAGSSSTRGLHVVGSHLRDSRGRTVILRGVDRSGTEYACVQGWGIFGSLVSSYDGTPANDYARWVQGFYAAHAATTYHPQ